jgi:general secretion pathway protein G
MRTRSFHLSRRAVYPERSRRGFTLIELVLVVTIIAILAGAIVIQATSRAKTARRARALMDMHTLEVNLDIYTADNGAPPTTQQGLAALLTKPTTPPVPLNWNGPYIKGLKKDPWAQDYVYHYPAESNPDKESYDLICYGSDRQPGGEGDGEDITNYETE